MCEIGAQYDGINLVALLPAPPPPFDMYPTVWLAGVRWAGPTFYQFLVVTDPDRAPLAVFEDYPPPGHPNFPFGYTVRPDVHA